MKRPDPPAPGPDLVELKMIRLGLMAVVVHGLIRESYQAEIEQGRDRLIATATALVDDMLKAEGLDK